ncbi:hypothetical protein PCANC_11981 [Puccinia coronata f. sp. avenae]|uniref:Uncharacterized protein n=1 Tax=Puccinia coronata f. sp. avenae TaxID=200324 RepID=A0A2N5SX23_9BASI|nr:hypothetical protein PCANC_11981 [Puccinia coronata f. sp. avenae]
MQQGGDLDVANGILIFKRVANQNPLLDTEIQMRESPMEIKDLLSESLRVTSPNSEVGPLILANPQEAFHWGVGSPNWNL